MTGYPPTNPTEPMNDQQLALLQRARKGVLKFLYERGGTLSIAELHDYSLNKFFIQHQRFSQMMEACVDEGLVTYDETAQTFILTETGKACIQ